MSQQELEDFLLVAVRQARPAIEDAASAPTSPDALRMLERVLRGNGFAAPSSGTSVRGRRVDNRRRSSRHLFGPRIGAIATAVAAVVAAAVIVLSGLSGATSLVDRAYASVNPRNQVLHELDIQTDHGLHGYFDRVEGWMLPADGRLRLIHIWGYKSALFVSESLTTGSGRTFGRTCLAQCHPAAFVKSRSGWSTAGPPGTFGETAGTLPGTFATWFRTAYLDHAVASAGTTRFAGKRVARFQSMVPSFASRLVFWRPGTPPPASARKDTTQPDPYTLIDWYVDSATAEPVGFMAVACGGAQIRSCDVPVSTTRIVTFERLDPTAQNLGLLTGPGAPASAR